MKKILIFVVVWMAVIFYSGAVFAESDVEKSLKTNFSDLKFESVAPSPVAGLYEVTVGPMIYYYAAHEGILINGNMFDKNKRNLTADKMQELRAKFEQEIALRAKELPLDKAVKVGA